MQTWLPVSNGNYIWHFKLGCLNPSANTSILEISPFPCLVLISLSGACEEGIVDTLGKAHSLFFLFTFLFWAGEEVFCTVHLTDQYLTLLIQVCSQKVKLTELQYRQKRKEKNSHLFVPFSAFSSEFRRLGHAVLMVSAARVRKKKRSLWVQVYCILILQVKALLGYAIFEICEQVLGQGKMFSANLLNLFYSAFQKNDFTFMKKMIYI